VRVLQGDVANTPLPDGAMDAVISQEAFLHVADKGRVVRESHRILRSGGRLAFTDWICHAPLSAADATLMWEGMAVQTLQTLDSYRSLIEGAGFGVIALEDLTAEWGPILQQRLPMYQAMRREAEAAGTPSGSAAFHRSYPRFVELVVTRQLGGVRATAEKQASCSYLQSKQAS
jgi:sarcosine/dimethylglycine N-methyltransferase